MRWVRAALVFPAALPLLLAAAPVPKHLMPKDEPLYLPTTVGAKSEHTDGSTYEVTGVEDADGGKVVTLTGRDGEIRWHACRTGLFLLSSGQQAWDPVMPMLRLPTAEHKTWEVQQVAGLKLHGRFAGGGVEEVEVKAGKFRAVRVDVEWVGINKHTTWYAPGVGEVKSTGGMVRELKSFTPGKQ